jgi:hypothetical protein
MINVLVYKTGPQFKQVYGHEKVSNLIAYFDTVSRAWLCVNACEDVRVKVVNDRANYKTWAVFLPAYPLQLRRPDGSVTPLVGGERIQAYFSNGKWHTWPKIS